VARHFARLKLTLLRSGLRVGGWQQLVGLVASLLIALPLAGAGFLALAAVRTASDLFAESVAVLGFVGLFLAWAVLPLLTFTADSSLDPAKLALLPLRPRQLAVGLFVASCIGVAPIATLAALAGAIVGFATAGPGLAVVLVAVLLELSLCVLAARAITTALSRWLRSRRVRDLAIVVASLGALALNLTVQVVVRVAHPGRLADLHWLRRSAEAVGWLPPGLAARAMFEAGRGGSLRVAVAELLGAAAAVLLLAWWWYASLRRVLTTAEPAGPPRRVAEAGAGVLPRPVRRLLPLDQRGAVAAKDLRYFARHPRLRVLWVTAAIFAIALPTFLVLASNGAPREGAALGALAGLYMLNSAALNQFGPDGSAYWTNVASGSDVRGDLVGKNLAFALPGFALVAVVATLLAAVGGGWAYLPVTLCLAAGALGVLLGVADYVSVRFPFPVTAVSTNLWATSGAGAGCLVGLVQLLAMVVEGAAMTPFAVLLAVGVAWWRPALVILCVVAPAWGYLFWWLGVRVGAEWLESHQPELLAALAPRRAG
jgi:ABC-2 type transport system permease protein